MFLKENEFFYALLLYRHLRLTRSHQLIFQHCCQRSAVCAVGAESRWRAFLHSWCDAGLSGYYIILALAKTVTPGGSPRREPGQPAPPLKVFHFDQKILAVQKPIAYTDLLGTGHIILSQLGPQGYPKPWNAFYNQTTL